MLTIEVKRDRERDPSYDELFGHDAAKKYKEESSRTLPLELVQAEKLELRTKSPSPQKLCSGLF
ncbi:hypothetical protein [uncultured Campylobacter sp.]|uniref:hypothetical protein n=1 Tax=uncultured Campylobacter sp. TaxID=218934 RepID=UPI0015AC08F8|nr:hypothetical protein [uncultured Campylobacter sp.]